MSDGGAGSGLRERCREALQHSPADGRGRCNWCGKRIASIAPRPTRSAVSILTQAYRRFYDPDWGGLPYDDDPLW